MESWPEEASCVGVHAAEEVVDAEVGHQHGQEGDDEVGVQH